MKAYILRPVGEEMREIPEEVEFWHANTSREIRKFSNIETDILILLDKSPDRDSYVLATGSFMGDFEKRLGTRIKKYDNAVVNKYHFNDIPKYLEAFGFPLCRVFIYGINPPELYFAQDMAKSLNTSEIPKLLKQLEEELIAPAEIIISPGEGVSAILSNKGLRIFEPYTPASLGKYLFEKKGYQNLTF